jgi:DNA-binding CsgD family transcriptional regulator
LTTVGDSGPGGAADHGLVGRADALDRIRALRSAAGQGALSVLILEGEAGIGKTALAEAAVRAAGSEGWTTVWVQGVESDTVLAHAGLFALASPLNEHLSRLAKPQRRALESAVGWVDPEPPGDRFAVAAATLGLLAAAAETAPLLVVVDDLPWLDRESADALLFAARRLRHDRVAVLLTRRAGDSTGPGVDDVERQPLSGLTSRDAEQLLGRDTALDVVERLTAQTGGNPLALLECVRTLTPLQRAGASMLPTTLPVPARLGELYGRDLAGLSEEGRAVVVLAAASHDQTLAPIADALADRGLEPAHCLDQAAGLIEPVGSVLVFRHPLLRSVAWQRASTAERRAAHGALATALPPGPARTWHRAEAAAGYDPDVARALAADAAAEGARRGYAAASVMYERAALLVREPQEAMSMLASAADDAYLAGDGERAGQLARQVLAGPAEDAERATALFVLGRLEQHRGTFVRARELLSTAAEAADAGAGRLLLRVLVELGSTCYLLDDSPGVSAVAAQAEARADDADPEQAMLAAYLAGSASVFAGQPEAGAPFVVRALELLESEPALRDDPRHLSVALLCARWLGDPHYVVGGLSVVQIGWRRIQAAREQGALGSLALGLLLAAGGLAWAGDHIAAYAIAGEAVELLDLLGYRIDGVAHETLAMESAARGQHAEATALLVRAEEIARATGATVRPPHLAYAVLNCALSRGDLGEVVRVAEEELRRRGSPDQLIELYGVAPALVEAYAGLGRMPEARALADRFLEAGAGASNPYLAAMVARCSGLVAEDLDDANAAFARAVTGQVVLGDCSETGRTRLLWGMRLRRAGQRVAARKRLREAADDFAAVHHAAWQDRVATELASTGERLRSRKAADVALSSSETRVALLVAQGMTNREVAAALFLSPKTVEHHLGAVLRKRGLRSRTELARDIAAASSPGG